MILMFFLFFFFFFNDTATTEIYTLSLHDALPISLWSGRRFASSLWLILTVEGGPRESFGFYRSEEHTSELQSQSNLVCRLLLEKKKKELRASSDTASSATVGSSESRRSHVCYSGR